MAQYYYFTMKMPRNAKVYHATRQQGLWWMHRGSILLENKDQIDSDDCESEKSGLVQSGSRNDEGWWVLPQLKIKTQLKYLSSFHENIHISVSCFCAR